jgi:uncharacterized phage-associated protein
MARAIDVAYYLIHLAAAEEEPQYLTHLQLQKLLYYVQGWSLAMRGEPMFPERIEAWAHGPVVPDLYPGFAIHGSLPIVPDVATTADEPGSSPEALRPGECDLIRSVWEVYRSYSASHLWRMTHSERPWVDARSGAAPADRCENEITQDVMKSFFSQLAEH